VHRIRSVRTAFVASTLATLAGCAATPATRCGDGQTSTVQEMVYFGRDKPDGQVSADDWAQFLNDIVTPRFPAGLSSWQATGQWQSASGGLVHEPSYVLSLVHPENEANENAVQEIVATYKSRFGQEAVLRMKSHACMSL